MHYGMCWAGPQGTFSAGAAITVVTLAGLFPVRKRCRRVRPTRSALSRPQMAPHEAVLVPDQSHHEDIECGERNKPHSVGV